MSHFTEYVTGESKISEVSARATSHPAAIANAAGCTAPRQTLKLTMEVHPFFLRRSSGNLLFKQLSLLSVFSDKVLALFLTLNHALFSHGFL